MMILASEVELSFFHNNRVEFHVQAFEYDTLYLSLYTLFILRQKLVVYRQTMQSFLAANPYVEQTFKPV